MTQEEMDEVLNKGPYDASITALTFAVPSVTSYAQCYKENLKPLFSSQEALPEDQRDPEL
jgi:hypothetical protein